MPAQVSVPLNSEPAQPEVRKQQDLPPKSYADAVEEDSPANGNTSNVTARPDASRQPNGNPNEDGNSGSKRKTVSVLKIMETGAEQKEAPVERPLLLRQESQQEYTATGIDDTPRTPIKHKHRKSTSTTSTTGSEDRPKSSDSGPEINGGSKQQDIDTATEKKPKSKSNGDPKQQKRDDTRDETTMFEKVNGQTNGGKLISVKPAVKFEEPQPSNKETAQRQSKDQGLKAGRKAGQRWQTSAIRFAPLNVPLQRRLQTLVVLFHTLSIALGVSVFFFLCAIPLFWPLLIPYMIYTMSSSASTDGRLRFRSDILRKSPIWSLFASYFPARLHRTQELPPTRKYIFGYHPHGIISHGAFAAFATEALGFSQLFPGIRNTLLTLDSNFRIPIYREYALGMGLASVSKESCENLLSKGGPNNEGMGRAITIVVGGARESLDALPYSLRLVLKRRKGFVKMAIRTGADLVPVLAFGENDLYDQFHAESHPRIHKAQLLVKKMLGFTIPLFHARGVFNYDVGLMPYRRPLNIVVGRPIKVTQSSKPEQEQIDRVHEEYVVELERLWNTWKDDFAPDRQEELQILE